MKRDRVVERAAIHFARAKTRTRDVIYAIAGIGLLLCFWHHDRHRRQEYHRAEKIRDPGWADPLPIRVRKRRRLSVCGTSLGQVHNPRRRLDRPCLLLERLPVEIRRQIFAYVVGNDAVLIIPRRKKFGHASLTDDHPIVHVTAKGAKCSIGREIATDSASFGFDPTRAMIMYPSVPNEDHVVFRTRLGSDGYSMHAIDGDGLTHAIRRLDRGQIDFKETRDSERSMHFFVGSWRAFWNPYRATRGIRRTTPSHHARLVGEGSDTLELGTKLALLRTCRQIYVEAMPYLYNSNTFVFPAESVFDHLPCFALPHHLAAISHLFIASRTGLNEFTDSELAHPGGDAWLIKQRTFELIQDYLIGLQTLNVTIEFNFSWDPPVITNRQVRQLRPTVQQMRGLAKNVTLCLNCEVPAEDDERNEQVRRWAEDIMVEHLTSEG